MSLITADGPNVRSNAVMEVDLCAVGSSEDPLLKAVIPDGISPKGETFARMKANCFCSFFSCRNVQSPGASALALVCHRFLGHLVTSVPLVFTQENLAGRININFEAETVRLISVLKALICVSL